MRELAYTRHEPGDKPRRLKRSLLEFVYDVPHLAPCGVFPPLHILNDLLRTGGGDAGMSPGASWEPFELDAGEYEALAKAVLDTSPTTFGSSPRFAQVQLMFDHDFDYIVDRMVWNRAVSEAHQQQWLNALFDAARTS
jgi:hypothetical protein